VCEKEHGDLPGTVFFFWVGFLVVTLRLLPRSGHSNPPSSDTAMPEYTIPCKRIVAYSEHDWKWEDMLTQELQDDEFLVQLIATGVYHTDISAYGGIHPRVVVHEGTFLYMIQFYTR
jgi:hypothetical protein